jgi:NADPH:quinone reductase-like Zn-dependent oxidoreductase
LFDKAGLNKGQKVRIHGAAGGVESFAVQLAKWKGAHVIDTASGKNQAFLRELGVDEAIDYEKTRFDDVVHDADVVLDTIGGDTEKRSWKVPKKGGILVSIVSPPSAEEAAKHGVRSEYFSAKSDASQLAQIAELVDSGKIKPIVESVLPLSEARRAHEMNEKATCTRQNRAESRLRSGRTASSMGFVTTSKERRVDWFRAACDRRQTNLLSQSSELTLVHCITICSTDSSR